MRTLRPAVLLLAPALLLAALAASAAAPQPPKRSDPIRLALQKGDPDAAVTAADAALKSFPKDTDVLLWAGRAYFSGEDLEKGVSCFERYLTLPVPEDGPTHADARWRKGLLLEKLGKTPAAIAEYREAPKADPAHRGARRELERLKAV